MATLDGFGFATRRNRSTLNSKLPSKIAGTVLPKTSVAFIQPIDSINNTSTAHSSPSLSSFQRQTTTRKPKKSTSSKKAYSTSNTITRYFTTAAPSNTAPNSTSAPSSSSMDVEMEEARSNDNDEEADDKATICVIRKKLSIINLWTQIEQEYMQFNDDEDDYLDQDYEEKTQEKQVQKLNISNNTNMDIHNSNEENSRGRCRRYSESEEQEEKEIPSILKLLATTTKRQKKSVDNELSDVMNQFLNLKSMILLPKRQISLLNSNDSMDEDDEGENLTRILRHKMTCEESSLFVLQITQEFLY